MASNTFISFSSVVANCVSNDIFAIGDIFATCNIFVVSNAFAVGNKFAAWFVKERITIGM